MVIGFSRIPNGRKYSGFSTTTTDEKYCAISTITNAVSTDYYELVGRFAATLSAGAGYTWTVPTFTAINLINYPILFTRRLLYAPVHTRSGTAYTNVPTNNACGYKVVGDKIFVDASWTQNAVPGGTLFALVSLPFTSNSANMVGVTINLTAGTTGGGLAIVASATARQYPTGAVALNQYNMDLTYSI